MRLLLGVALALLAGCGGCHRAVSAVTRRVPQDVIRQEVVRRLQEDPQTATTVCGIPASGLVNLEIVSASDALVNEDATNRTLQFASGARAHVRGTPRDANAPPVRCEALIEFVFHEQAAGWVLTGAVVLQVMTPGVQFVGPHRSGGHHHHHH